MTETHDTAALTATIKFGPGYEAPWLVLRADNPPALENLLLEVGRASAAGYSVADLVAQFAVKVGKSYQAERAPGVDPVAVATQVLDGQVVGQQAVPPAGTGYAQTPTPAPAASQGQAAPGPSCQHGLRVHRSGSSAKGPWSAWFCPTPKGTPGQCEPQWDKR